MIERGTGSPLVLVPGIVGRWEWLTRAVDALSRHHRVLTFSLNDVEGPDIFERWSDHIDRLLDDAHVTNVPVVGVSFGGLIAAGYAATRRERVQSLVLASTPAPHWRIDKSTARLARHPRLLFPMFAWRAIGRVRREVATALPSAAARLALAANHTARAVTCPLSPRRMAEWVDAWSETDLAPHLSRITAPTLVLTGEPALDRVVPVSSSLEYLSLIPGATHATLAGTGHLGFTTRPREFAALVTDFVEHGARAANGTQPREQESISACV